MTKIVGLFTALTGASLPRTGELHTCTPCAGTVVLTCIAPVVALSLFCGCCCCNMTVGGGPDIGGVLPATVASSANARGGCRVTVAETTVAETTVAGATVAGATVAGATVAGATVAGATVVGTLTGTGAAGFAFVGTVGGIGVGGIGTVDTRVGDICV